MFGIGFTELLIIAIIAILFLGPDKLPSALVDMAKFIRAVKKTISEAKTSIEEEVKIADLKEEALGYKQQLDNATEELRGFKNLSLDDFDDSSYDDEVSTKSAQEMAKQPQQIKTTEIETKNELVTFTKKETPKVDISKKIEKKGDA
jgi:sec-independent protein translocase protein TatB